MFLVFLLRSLVVLVDGFKKLVQFLAIVLLGASKPLVRQVLLVVLFLFCRDDCFYWMFDDFFC